MPRGSCPLARRGSRGLQPWAPSRGDAGPPCSELRAGVPSLERRAAVDGLEPAAPARQQLGPRLPRACWAS
eukprot:6259603-Pyramimonas_sp.AAC.1